MLQRVGLLDRHQRAMDLCTLFCSVATMVGITEIPVDSPIDRGRRFAFGISVGAKCHGLKLEGEEVLGVAWGGWENKVG